MKRPRLKTQLALIPYLDKLSIGSTENIALEIQDPNRLVYSILKECNGKNDIDEIYNKIHKNFNINKKDILDILNQIAEYPYILEEGELEYDSNLSEIQKNRYSRNMNFLSNFDSTGQNKYKYMEELINKNVLVIGLGGVGSSIILSLAALGVSNIIGVDFDTVELSNLNRQLLYDESDIGKLKSEAAPNRIKKFNSLINFKTYNVYIDSTEKIEELIDKHNIDFIFCAADEPPIYIYTWINEACANKNIPWIFGGNNEASSYFQTIIPGETSCYNCNKLNLFENSFEGKEKYNEVLKYGYKTQNNCTSATSGCLTGFMILDFIRVFLKFEKPKAINKLFCIDYRNYSIFYEDRNISKNCIYCNKRK